MRLRALILAALVACASVPARAQVTTSPTPGLPRPGADCADSGGNHLNWTAAAGITCGTSSGASGANTALSNVASVAIPAATPIGLGGTSNSFPAIEWNTVQTPDTAGLWTGSTSNHWIIAERADSGFDFAHAAATDPTLFIHSHNQNTAQWLGLTHNGTDGVISVGTGGLQVPKNIGINTAPNLSYLLESTTTTNAIARMVTTSAGDNYAESEVNNNTQNGYILLNGVSYSGTGTYMPGLANAGLFALRTTGTALTINTGAASPVVIGTNTQVRDYIEDSAKTLTESSATSVVRIDVASGSYGGGRIFYTVYAADASDKQQRSGSVAFAIVNKAGTETCTVSGASETADGSTLAASTGTLTYAITTDTSPTNGCNLQWNAVSSLTQTTLKITYRVLLESDVSTTSVNPL